MTINLARVTQAFFILKNTKQPPIKPGCVVGRLSESFSNAIHTDLLCSLLKRLMDQTILQEIRPVSKRQTGLLPFQEFCLAFLTWPAKVNFPLPATRDLGPARKNSCVYLYFKNNRISKLRKLENSSDLN